MAIKRNYFFEELTEEDPTPLSNDPNLNDYDKTDSYSQYLDYDDVAGTVDIDLGGGKDEELDGDGTPSLEQSILEDVIFDEAYTAYLTEAKIESKEDLERELAKLDGKPNAAIKAVGIAAMVLTGTAAFAASLTIGGQIANKVGSTAAPMLVKGMANFGAGILVGSITMNAISPVLTFIARQVCDKGQKVRAAKKLIKEIDKAIVKAEKAKSKKDADTKAIDKHIKDLKSGKAKAEKALTKFEKLPDDYTYKESYSYTDFYYMEENNIMDGIFLDAMQESYMDDLKIMDAIGKSYSMMYTLSEAGINEDAQEEANGKQKQGIVSKIIEAIKSFFGKIKGVIDRIINWFKQKFNKDKKLHDALASSGQANTAVDVDLSKIYEKEALEVAAKDVIEKTEEVAAYIADIFGSSSINDAKNKFKKVEDRVAKIVDVAYESYRKNYRGSGGDMMSKSDFERILFGKATDQEKANLDTYIRKSKAAEDKKAADKFANAFNPNVPGEQKPDTAPRYNKATGQYVHNSSYFDFDADIFTEAETTGKMKVKDVLNKWMEGWKQHKHFNKLKSRVEQALKKAENEIKKYQGSTEDYNVLSKMFTYCKTYVLKGTNGALNMMSNAYNKITGVMKSISGKLIKPKEEAFRNISDEALGEMVYAHYTMQEADVTFGDGVDVTDVMDSTIGDGETITKEKTVCVNNESYRVKVSATRI